MTNTMHITEKFRVPHATALAAVLAISALGGIADSFAIDRVEIPAVNSSDAGAATNASGPTHRSKPLTQDKTISGLDALYAEYIDYQAAATSGRQAPFQPKRTLAQVTPDGLVVIDAVAADDPEQLRADLEALGAEVTAVAGWMVSARLRIDQIPALDGVESLALRPARRRGDEHRVRNLPG